MTQFRKKPVVIEAKQATGTPESNREIIDWTRGCATPAFMDSEVRNCSAEHPDGFDYPVLKINTLEGTMTVKPGDWIIEGVKGEFYPCKPDIFAATYEAAQPATAMNFGYALDAIKAGKRIARTGWNGKGMFVYLVPPASYPVQTGAAKAHFGDGAMVPYNAYMAIKNVDGTVSTWVPSVNDCLAADWSIVGDVACESDHPPHQQRVLDEKRELDEKLQKLTAFISSEKFSTIVQDEAERGRLVCQEETMKDYSAILAERIEAFGAAPIALPVIDPGPDSLEREIQAKASNGPRVTPADIEAEIASEHYFTAEDGVGRASKGQTSNGGKNPASLSLLTFCVLVLRNGFTVTGESACASPENFNAEIGRRIARENAVAKVWPLLGFRLRDKLASVQSNQASAP